MDRQIGRQTNRQLYTRAHIRIDVPEAITSEVKIPFPVPLSFFKPPGRIMVQSYIHICLFMNIYIYRYIHIQIHIQKYIQIYLQIYL
jgi:hypothetical protein